MRDPDHSLATRAQRGDRAALADLYNRHRGKFLGFLRRAAGNPELAEEVFQDVWAKVIQVMGSYDPGRAPFRSWLYQVGANAVVDRLRRESYRRSLPLEEPLSEGGEAPVDRIPSAVAARGELEKAFAQLPDPQRVAVLLRHQQGFTYAEISSSLGVPEGTAKTMVHRGVMALRRILGNGEED
jgi:RNA polymerase sigma-70 factor (ECF subfamily)